jgi:hypothetical protein
MENAILFILGNLSIACIIAANVLVYRVKFAIRKKGYPVSWLCYLGMHNDLTSLKKIVAAAESPEERLGYTRCLRAIYLSYVVFGLGLLLMLVVWLSLVPRL